MKPTAPSGGARAYFFSSSGSGSSSVMPICSSSGLVAAGYAPVHRKGRPVGGEQPRRFEAPHRGALWQLDFTELRVGSERRWLLVIGGVAAELGIGCGRLEREAAGVAITSAS
jgi:hypothetical protein